MALLSEGDSVTRAIKQAGSPTLVLVERGVVARRPADAGRTELRPGRRRRVPHPLDTGAPRRGAGAASWGRPLRAVVAVRGNSMSPTLHDRQRLVARRLGHSPAPGNPGPLRQGFEALLDAVRDTGAGDEEAGVRVRGIREEALRIKHEYFLGNTETNTIQLQLHAHIPSH